MRQWLSIRYYRVGRTWVLTMRTSVGLIHLGSSRWWRPLVEFIPCYREHMSLFSSTENK